MNLGTKNEAFPHVIVDHQIQIAFAIPCFLLFDDGLHELRGIEEIERNKMEKLCL